MRDLNLMMAFGVLAACLLNASGHELDASIVEYRSTFLKHGRNEVVVNCDVVSSESAFSTFDEIVRFVPADGILGDELEFSLDGFKQQYKFIEYTSTNNVYHLVRLGTDTILPEIISLDTIPLPDKFWIYHSNTNDVSVTTIGETSPKYIRSVQYCQSPNEARPPLEVRFVPEDSPGRSFTFGGGGIEVKPCHE